MRHPRARRSARRRSPSIRSFDQGQTWSKKAITIVSRIDPNYPGPVRSRQPEPVRSAAVSCPPSRSTASTGVLYAVWEDDADLAGNRRDPLLPVERRRLDLVGAGRRSTRRRPPSRLGDQQAFTPEVSVRRGRDRRSHVLRPPQQHPGARPPHRLLDRSTATAPAAARLAGRGTRRTWPARSTSSRPRTPAATSSATTRASCRSETSFGSLLRPGDQPGDEPERRLLLARLPRRPDPVVAPRPRAAPLLYQHAEALPARPLAGQRLEPEALLAPRRQRPRLLQRAVAAQPGRLVARRAPCAGPRPRRRRAPRRSRRRP